MAADDHNERYHISTVRVQLNLEVIEAEGDSKRTSQATIRWTHFVTENGRPCRRKALTLRQSREARRARPVGGGTHHY